MKIKVFTWNTYNFNGNQYRISKTDILALRMNKIKGLELKTEMVVGFVHII